MTDGRITYNYVETSSNHQAHTGSNQHNEQAYGEKDAEPHHFERPTSHTIDYDREKETAEQ